MLVRIITSIIGFPIFAFFIVLGGVPLKFLVGLMALIGMNELFKVLCEKNLIVHSINYVFIFIFYLFLDRFYLEHFMAFIFLYIMCNLVYLVLKHEKVTPVQISYNIFSFFYVGLMMSSIYWVREYVYGQYLVWLIFISAWGSDTFAYFTGVFFGKNKLTPKLSPKKTIEGSIGGILATIILGGIYAYFIADKFDYSQNSLILYFSVISGIAAIFSQFGDLTASAIKRYMKVKDYGKIIPGHGGIMDRFDSILFTAPIIYIVIIFLIK